MKRLASAFLAATALVSAFAADKLPVQDDQDALEIEPPLLIKSRAADGSPEAIATAGTPDLTRLEAAVARAKQSAASAERLFRAGVLAKVEAEQRGLRVVRLQADLAQTQLEQVKYEEEQRPRSDSAATQTSSKSAALAQAIEAAKTAVAERGRAELAAAAANLERQRKLLALGSGRKADVSRAEEKLAKLKRPSD